MSVPVLGPEPVVPGKTGFLFISSEVVEMRKDALSEAEIEAKLDRIRKIFHSISDFCGPRNHATDLRVSTKGGKTWARSCNGRPRRENVGRD